MKVPCQSFYDVNNIVISKLKVLIKNTYNNILFSVTTDDKV